MTDVRPESQEPQGLLGVLLAPLRAPQRVVNDIETIAQALLALQRDARDRLASVDERVGGILGAVGALRAPLERVDAKVTELATLEEVLTVRMDALGDGLDERLAAVGEEVRGMRAPIERMSRDLAAVVELLPNPSDGPLGRLKDTLTSS